MKFELTALEVKALKKFEEGIEALPAFIKDRKKIKKGKQPNYKWNRSIEFSFGNGIGIGVTARYGVYEEDITDYGSW